MLLIIYDAFGKEYRLHVGKRIWQTPEGAIHLSLQGAYPINDGEPRRARSIYSVEWPEARKRYRIVDMGGSFRDTALVARVHAIYFEGGDEIVLLPKEERGRVVQEGTNRLPF